jgi:ribosomal protein S16
MSNVSPVKTYEWRDGRKIELIGNSKPPVPSQKRRLEHYLRECARSKYEKGGQ